MIRKFYSERDKKLLTNLPFKYESSEIYLDFAGYVIERNGESNLAVQDVLYPNDFPYLYLPKKRENWPHSIIQWVSSDELDKLKSQVAIEKSFPSGREFYYRTKDFIDLNGGRWSRFRKDLHKFTKNYKYTLHSSYPDDKVEHFIKNVWLTEQKDKTASFNESYDFFFFCLKNQQKYNIKTLYVEIAGELVGLATGAPYNDSNDKWLALHIKVDYNYDGLSKFLYHERAKIFFGYDQFTSGATCAGDEGIEKFKNSLNPHRVEETYYVITGDWL